MAKTRKHYNNIQRLINVRRCLKKSNNIGEFNFANKNCIFLQAKVASTISTVRQHLNLTCVVAEKTKVIKRIFYARVCPPVYFPALVTPLPKKKQTTTLFCCTQ